MIAKLSPGALTGVVVPVSAALAEAPWWAFAGMTLLALVHRMLPRDSKDLLNLWLRIISRRRGPKDKRDEGRGT
ncbi:hypothetical protein [Micromonospora sagamiensis]|uniref:Uncharacterized protein n=1 Tax=Micromonospora sagamiensis TaxID=47875 RepID=A0A562WKW9_9ACTN|nr:hypothetical protein [Micromonospora sagamiensis]TWJ30940.1 hypothetical protein JD81_04489 [Micromonospora sagamiensis]BCL16020.1 hypothetical protein GCM10017556_37590 [Micromonospora sagamiensis]